MQKSKIKMQNDSTKIKNDEEEKLGVAEEPEETKYKIKEKDEYKERVADLENQIKRVLADYQNLEKRVREERVNWIQTANKELLLRILPVLDTLILASKHSEDKSLHVSVSQFLQALKDEGVEKIETTGKNFDPHTMECVTTEEGEEGKVLEETRAGFKIGDIVLRPAQVIVGA